MVSRVERGALADWFWTIDRFFLAIFILLMGIGFMLSFAGSPAVAAIVPRASATAASCS